MKTCPKCNNSFEDTVGFCPRDGEVLTDAVADIVGQVLDGQYEVEAFLAQGGMGAVYRARHILLGDRVVIKTLRSEMRNNAEWLRRFQREGRAARRFRHPNAVTVYDLRTASDGMIYMVMEYVDGHTLDKELKQRGRFTSGEALDVLEPVANVLEAAHAMGVVHRDLKPENVMLSKSDDGRPMIKLLDLGIAKMTGMPDSVESEGTSLTVAGQILGTPYYMSPEQWGEPARDGNPEVDGRTDIYSLGVMFYELVAGRKPLGGRTLAELRNGHVSTRLTPLGDVVGGVPEGFSRAIDRAMAKDRNDRQATAGEFIDELRASLGLPVIPRRVATTGGDAATQKPAPDSEAKTANLAANTTATKPESGSAATILTSDMSASQFDATAAGGAASSARATSANLAGHTDAGGHGTAATVAMPRHGGGATVVHDGARAALSPGTITVESGATPAREIIAPPGRSIMPFIAGAALLLLLVGGGLGWFAWTRFINKPATPDNTNTAVVNNGKGTAQPPTARAEAMRYWMEVYDVPQKKDVLRIADTSAPVESGKDFKFQFWSKERGFLYIIGPYGDDNAPAMFLSAKGGPGLKTNQILRDAVFSFPFGKAPNGENYTLKLGVNPGTEEFTVIFSPTPLMSPSAFVEDFGHVLTPTQLKELEDFRAQHKAIEPALEVNAPEGADKGYVSVSVPTARAEGQPFIFDIRIQHK